MKWLDNWLYSKVRDMWDNKHRYEEAMNERDYKRSRALKMNTIGSAQVERGSPEGEDRISFELSTAIGGRIVNVRRYDNRKEQHNSTTYVIPNGEDVGSRVAKIINIELIK
jgi:hypothetical protein